MQSLAGVGLEIARGEVHALAGENGAGKSTLVRLLAGVEQPDAGRIMFDGAPVAWTSPRNAQDSGIHVIYQEFALFPDLSVAENIFLGAEPRRAAVLMRRRDAERQARDALARFGLDLDPRTRVAGLSVAQKQLVEVARALVRDVKLLIMDEPTAVLGEAESETLLRQVRVLRDSGVAVLYITHRLGEIGAMCDRVSVLKDGRNVATLPVAGLDRARLVSLMVGREVTQLYPPRPARAPEAVTVEASGLRLGRRLRDVSFAIRPGEILGVAGLPDSGRREIALAMFGAARLEAGTIRVGGRNLAPLDVRRAIGAGIGFVTEDRKAEGLLRTIDLAGNVVAPTLKAITRRGLLYHAEESAIARQAITAFGVACRGPRSDVMLLSGGNQQKVLLARWARVAERLLILSEPTRGVDIGAKAEIYRLIRARAAQGVPVLLTSSELPELLGVADRIVVMREGSIVATFDARAASEDAIMHEAAVH